ncbi:uncharacterized protein LAESUDRAFT_811235 [Laetiporus sulphureus 93-53]|uniref:DRBM domain-containing protein n=1 Tax=Laetiporus sulphureus 93-53 TaxID=1314785 RepID=A0A165F951_9APHY|nr:uncharacterized protein LAESUDRAFT_811235 [Laetiporus sulphureus 93-53]KZT08620.1 hypothetical protein LAESUDRAFT_811235 [Laetiporus sulphureus 93-53]
MSSETGTVDLNNYLQSKELLSQLSWEESFTGPRHAPEWTSVCKLSGAVIGRGTGSSKHAARDMAAKAALEHLMQENADE